MSAHSTQADFCPGCGYRFLFLVHHLPHCKNPRFSKVIPSLLKQHKRNALGVQGSSH